MNGTVLVINSGSSSIKFQLVDPEPGDVLAKGLVERIGEDEGRLSCTAGGETRERTERIADHSAGFALALAELTDSGVLDPDTLTAIGHRVVHGGAVFGEPVLIDDHVVSEIHRLSALAPLHNPANAVGIEILRSTLPGVPEVAVFDTAFFHDLPAAAATFAIDRDVARENRVRRYGFHGTSHQYVSERVADVLGRPLGELRQIVFHLGNGASASAISGGRAQDTTMGMTPLDGLVMGTRSGDIDAGVLFQLHRQAGMKVDELDDLLNRRSGLKGLAGVNDFRALTELIEQGDADAQLAWDVYVHRARKYLGAYLVLLGGVDAITFTAGVGENVPALRAAILQGLEPFGIVVDPDRNASGSGERHIGADGSATALLVIPTDEELAIARAAATLVRGSR
ncbi:acetate kinase [Rhodococcus rhodnii]|uniref:Acetate kinase n=2 Tax=Rhodococcus rhodnii TaxID=38312 RepID=R7WRQ5_9NOCA|nr:acetate kinase [Rhodococcus rhodnii]EOM77991.1 acetate kinase [Rhodococcus rhodnii LMG 5362]TXG92056.1 acetate kinase [Rhodococcus rhodnii]